MSRMAGYLSRPRASGVRLPFRLVLPAASDAAVIRAIRLERRDIFDPQERYWLARVANALHLETRAPTIRRELLFKVGEPSPNPLAAS